MYVCSMYVLCWARRGPRLYVRMIVSTYVCILLLTKAGSTAVCECVGTVVFKIIEGLEIAFNGFFNSSLLPERR
jgi:hypothetical protein